MRTFRAIAVLVVLAMFILVPAVSGQCRSTGIDVKGVEKLVAAGDVAALDGAFRRIGAKDPAMVALYRARRYALNPTDAEGARFMNGLPKTAEDLKRISLLAQTTDVCELPEVSEAVYGMFTTAAQIAQKLGKSHRTVMATVALADQQMEGNALPAIDWMLDNDRKPAVAALRGLPEKDRMKICHGKDPKSLKEQQILEECRSGM
jgi:hypothetical protein